MREPTETTFGSADVLRGMVDRYIERFPTVSRQQLSLSLGLPKNKIADWVSKTTDLRRRIPVSKIKPICVALMSTKKEQDELMLSRIEELGCNKEARLAVDFLLAQYFEKNHEEAVLHRVIRAALSKYPRGLYPSESLESFLIFLISGVLRTSENLFSEEDEQARQLQSQMSEAELKTAGDLQESVMTRLGAQFALMHENLRKARREALARGEPSERVDALYLAKAMFDSDSDPFVQFAS